MLKRLVARALGGQIGLVALSRQEQPLRSRAHNRIGMLPAMLLELALGVTKPPLRP